MHHDFSNSIVPAKASITEVGALKARFSKIHVPKHSSFELYVSQIRLAEISAMKISLGKICA